MILLLVGIVKEPAEAQESWRGIFAKNLPFTLPHCQGPKTFDVAREMMIQWRIFYR